MYTVYNASVLTKYIPCLKQAITSLISVIFIICTSEGESKFSSVFWGFFLGGVVVVGFFWRGLVVGFGFFGWGRGDAQLKANMNPKFILSGISRHLLKEFCHTDLHIS